MLTLHLQNQFNRKTAHKKKRAWKGRNDEEFTWADDECHSNNYQLCVYLFILILCPSAKRKFIRQNFMHCNIHVMTIIIMMTVKSAAFCTKSICCALFSFAKIAV
jgi:hypothetical protein